MEAVHCNSRGIFVGLGHGPDNFDAQPGKGFNQDPIGLGPRALAPNAAEPISFSLQQGQGATDNAPRGRKRERRGPGFRILDTLMNSSGAFTDPLMQPGRPIRSAPSGKLGTTAWTAPCT